jgi:hypothetical protein
MKALQHLLCGAVLLAGALLASGCAVNTYRAPLRLPVGLLYTDVRAPLMVDFNQTPACTEQGSASSLCFQDWLLTGIAVAWDDCSVEAAARAGGLREVAYADYELHTVLGFFGRMTVTAYGTK